MAFVLDDRVIETASSPGQGDFELLGAVEKSRSFVAGIGSGNTTRYLAVGAEGAEIGVAQVLAGSPDRLVRPSTVKNMTGTTTPVNFSGLVTVSCIASADDVPWIDEDGNLSKGVLGGVGGLTSLPPGNDMDNLSQGVTRLFQVNAETANSPAPMRGHGIHWQRSSGGGEAQFMIGEDPNLPLMGFRTRVAGDWLPWMEIFHSGNIVATGQNANGEYALLGGGLLICHRVVELDLSTTGFAANTFDTPAQALGNLFGGFVFTSTPTNSNLLDAMAAVILSMDSSTWRLNARYAYSGTVSANLWMMGVGV